MRKLSACHNSFDQWMITYELPSFGLGEIQASTNVSGISFGFS